MCIKQTPYTVREVLNTLYYGEESIEDTQIVCDGIYLPVRNNLDRGVISFCEHQALIGFEGEPPFAYTTKIVFHVCA